MKKMTIGKKIASGFAMSVTLTILVVVVSFYSLSESTTQKDYLIQVNTQTLERVGSIRLNVQQKASKLRGFLLSGDDAYLQDLTIENEQLEDSIRKAILQTEDVEEKRLLGNIDMRSKAYQSGIVSILQKKNSDISSAEIERAFINNLNPALENLLSEISDYAAFKHQKLERRKAEVNETISDIITTLIIVSLALVIVSVFIAVFIVRSLNKQIGEAIQNIKSSSTELRTTANQQASLTKEHTSAIAEISTTLGQLLASARQIAESATRVSDISQSANRAAREGNSVVERSKTAFDEIQKQVDLIVEHMLELGKKSQRVGGILDIINELAEQTNILAINATIEAAGAGEAGRRFSVVGEEVRQLSERVSSSTKEIRILIEEIRSSVTTTVMSTESGAKAVVGGIQNFKELTAAFDEIDGLVEETKDSAKEIELSTRQQSTAVEQVNQMIATAAQTTREAEAGSSQTAQTANELAHLSSNLSELIERRAVS